VTVEDVNILTHRYATAMRRVAQDMGVGFVSLFDEFRRIEQALSGNGSLYADEVHLNATGDLLYSQLVFAYLGSEKAFRTLKQIDFNFISRYNQIAGGDNVG
jgi:hypothetical protein